MASTQLRASLFHGFSDPSRLAILEQLLDGPRRVSDIVQATGLAQPNVSAHLACLWDCGLVARLTANSRRPIRPATVAVALRELEAAAPRWALTTGTLRRKWRLASSTPSRSG